MKFSTWMCVGVCSAGFLMAAALSAREPTDIRKPDAKSDTKLAAPETKAATPKTPGVVKTSVVAGGFDNPTGVALHLDRDDIYVAAHPGIFRVVPGKPARVLPEITGFKTDIYGKGPKYEIGPLGIEFLDEEHLVVGDGSLPDGEEVVRIYDIEEDAPDKPAAADSAEWTLGPIKPGEASAKGEGNFYGVAINDRAIFITSNGDDTKGWVLKANLDEDGKPGELKPFIATKVAVNVDAPVAITFTADGKELVVGQMGEINVPGDSLLTFYDPETGKLLHSYKTGLNDIAGLAYSSRGGKLYAVDFSWMKPEDGGLFRLDIEGDAVKATKIVSLDKPTALVFDDEGNLYITVFGTRKEGSETPPGELLKIDAGL